MTKSTKQKILSVVFTTTMTAAALHVANRTICSLATKNERIRAGSGHYYKWRFGNIFYTKQGSGKPLLLIHDLDVTASAYEWHRVTQQLSKTHTVYTIDLIGCGRSDKPALTYTNFLYVQLISDFIQHIIGHKTDIAVTGLSTSFVIMACHIHPEFFDKIILINPANLLLLNQIPSRYTRTVKSLLELPVIGTFLYNLQTSRRNIRRFFVNNYYFPKKKCPKKYIASYYEASHLGGGNARFLSASLKGRFVNISIVHALKQLENHILLIYGENVPDSRQITESYHEVNSSIRQGSILQTGYLPQLEDPAALIVRINTYLQ